MQVTYGDEEIALFAKVRRLMEHDDIRGGYRPVVIGYWCQRGYTHCPACLPDAGAQLPGRTDAIYSDNCAAEGERCDFCGASLMVLALETYGRTDCNTGRA